MADKMIPNSEPLEEIAREGATRRDLFKTAGATALGAALFASAGFDPALAQELKASDRPLRRPPSPTRVFRRRGAPRANRRPKPGAS